MKYSLSSYKIILFLLVILMSQFSHAQKKVHVLTKTIKKELKSADKTLVLRGEKSKINVSSWDNNFYFVEIKLISKNLNKNLAEKDLQIVKYQITETDKNYLLKNYFSSKAWAPFSMSFCSGPPGA